MSGSQQQAPVVRIHTEKKVLMLHFVQIFQDLQAFHLNLGSIFKHDKITIGETNGLICGE